MYMWTGTRAVACMHRQATTTASVVCPSLSLSVKTAYTCKLLAHPHNPVSKEFISSRYGIPLASPRSLPTPVYRELEVETVATKPLTGPTVNQLAAVPHSKRQGSTVSVCVCACVCVCVHIVQCQSF